MAARTLRLTFKTSGDGIELVSVERLGIKTPGQAGPQPRAAVNGGQWFELRARQGNVLAHRLVDPSVLNSAEVHSPYGSPQRVFGEMKDTVFEVLLPDSDDAQTVTLVGNPVAPAAVRRAIGPRAVASAAGLEAAPAGPEATDLATFELFPNPGGNR